VQLDLYTQIILSVLSVYQSANKGICNNDTGWKLKIKMNIKNWTACVQDRVKWKNVVEKAKTFNKQGS
jgi:hypothetical protein